MKSISVSLGRRHRLTGYGLLLALLTALLSGLLSPHAVHAEEDCTPSDDTSCVQGIIRSSEKEPLSGVEIELSGGAETLTTQTNDEGRWVFTVHEEGEYTVTVNEETLPDGQFLAQTDTREITVRLHQAPSALFPLTDDEAASHEAAPSGDEPAEAGAKKKSNANPFSWPRFWQQLVSGIRLGLLIALASLGLSLTYGTTGISNFSQGEMVSLGGILAAVFMTLSGNLWIAGALAVAASALFGYVQDAVIWRPLTRRRLSLMQLMIVSIGLSILMQYTFQFFFGAGVIRVDSRSSPTVEFWGITLTTQSVLAMIVSAIAIAAVGLALMFTRFGRATRAISDNPALAQASGINVQRVVRLVWIIGGGLAGLAGVFFGLVFNGISWFTGGQMLLLFFAAVTLGGLGTAFGAFVGSMVIGLVVEMTNIWLPGDLKYATALLILILILLIRPQGLFGRKERIG